MGFDFSINGLGNGMGIEYPSYVSGHLNEATFTSNGHVQMTITNIDAHSLSFTGTGHLIDRTNFDDRYGADVIVSGTVAISG